VGDDEWMKMTNMTVVGCGYLGAVHAACMAQSGHQVVGIDVDGPKVESLSAGRPSRASAGQADRSVRRFP
jgi:UDP-glucose 6-dehydrogenase